MSVTAPKNTPDPRPLKLNVWARAPRPDTSTHAQISDNSASSLTGVGAVGLGLLRTRRRWISESTGSDSR